MRICKINLKAVSECDCEHCEDRNMYEGECVNTCESSSEKDMAVAGKTERLSDKDILNELQDQEVWWMNSIDALSEKLESEKEELARVRRLISILEDRI